MHTFKRDSSGQLYGLLHAPTASAAAKTGLRAPESGAFENRLKKLGVDLSKYSGIEERQVFEPLPAAKNRTIFWSLMRSYRDSLTNRVPDPCIMTQIVTTRCNYNCGFCSFADSLNKKTNDLSLAEVENLYRTVGSSLNVIIYSGGETTINKDLPDMIEAAYRLTSVESVFIISNAWSPERLFEITHRIAQSCPDLHLTWSLSIEGPRDINNAVRGTKNKAWDAWQNTIDAMEGIKAIRRRFNYKSVDVQLCTVCSPGNADMLDSWYETVRDELRPDKWNLNLMRRSSQMSSSGLPTFDERRASKALQPFEAKYIEITERLKKDVLAGKLKFLYHTRTAQDGALKSAVDLLSQEANRRTILEQPQKFCCRAGTMGAYVSSEGLISACEEFAHSIDNSKVFGNLRLEDYNFQKIWRGQKASEFRGDVGKAPQCHGCTLESQRNYPAILVSFKSLVEADGMARTIRAND